MSKKIRSPRVFPLATPPKTNIFEPTIWAVWADRGSGVRPDVCNFSHR